MVKVYSAAWGSVVEKAEGKERKIRAAEESNQGRVSAAVAVVSDL